MRAGLAAGDETLAGCALDMLRIRLLYDFVMRQRVGD